MKSESHRKKDRQRNLLPAKTGIMVLFMTFIMTIIYHHKSRKSRRKSRKKSKKKTERDNERAARFQARKRQCERDAAASEASMGASPPPTTSSPSSAFIFSEPIPENVSSNSNFADLNIDGNVTISSEASRTDVRTGVGTTKSAVTCSPKQEAELIKVFGEFMGKLVSSTPAKIQASISKHQEDKRPRRL